MIVKKSYKWMGVMLMVLGNLLWSLSVVLSTQGTNNLEQELVAYWRFDEGEGDIAFDSSGNENIATLMGRPTWVAGVINSALLFDGVDDYAEVLDDPSVDIGTRDFTIALWFKGRIIIAKAEGWPQQGGIGFVLYTRSSNPYIVFQWGDGMRHQYFGFSGASLNGNAWHHAAISIDRDGRIKGFVDGEPTTIAPTPQLGDVNVTHNLRLQRYGYDQFASGTLDEVRIYKRALSEEDVQALYRQVRPK